MDPVLPYRGDGSDRPAGLALPPARMPLWHRRRALKRWRYFGVYGGSFMACAGVVRIAGLPQAFWALWDREHARLHERTALIRTGHVKLAADRLAVDDAGVVLDLTLAPAGTPVEVVSDHRGAHIWTRKQPLEATGTVTIDGVARPLDARGIVDDSAGYYARRTDWEWAAGVGVGTRGEAVAWNVVAGVHDALEGSERTVWIDGVPLEPGPVDFSTALDRVAFRDGGELRFTEEAVRRRHENLGVIASDYVQPFGLASGTLPGGVALAEGYGVMERHRARW